MRSSCLLISLLFSLSTVYAQCPPPTIVAPDTVCTAQTFPVSASDTSANNTVLWDFCAGGILADPTLVEASTSSLSGTQGFDLLFEAGEWIAFVTSRSDDRVYRLEYGDSLSNSPDIVDLGSFGGLISDPGGIKVLKDEQNEWYAFVSNDNSTNPIVRIAFGSNLKNNAPSVTGLGSPGALQRARGLDILKFQGNYYASLVTSTSRRVVTVDLGTSLGAPPAGLQVSAPLVLPNGNVFFDIDLISDCSGWYGFTISQDGVLYKITYGDNLNPVAFESFSIGGSNNTSASVTYDAGQYYILVSRLNGTVSRSALGNSLSQTLSPGELVQVGNTGGNNIDGSFLERNDKRLYATINFSTRDILLYDFAQACEVTPPVAFENSSVVRYDAPGQYTQDLILTNAEGLTARKSISITVADDLLGLQITTTAQCTSEPTQFAATADEAIESWLWTFEDGTTATGPTTSKQFTAPGTYSVTLEASAATGCQNQITRTFTIFPDPPTYPNSAFTTPDEVCSFEPVTFTDQSTWADGTIVRWFWDFGDGAFSNEQNPTHTFEAPGTYTVTLIASDSSGCGTPVAQTVTVQPGPNTNFSFGDLCLGETVTFQDLTTFAGGTDFSSRRWDFGDPTTDADTSLLAQPSYAYADTGTYVVTLTVTNSIGCQTTLTQPVRIYPLPVADFTFPATVLTGDSIPFADATTVVGQNAVAWSWNFGDCDLDPENCTASGAQAVHVYATPGLYDVTLIVTTDQGCTDTLTQSLTVEAPCPRAAFEAPTTASVGAPVSFTNQTPSLDSAAYFWDFNTGEVGQPPVIATGGQLPGFAANPSAPAVAYDDQAVGWYGFVVSRNNDNLVRLDYGVQLGGAPTAVLNLGDFNLNNPQEIEVFEHQGAWYGLVLDNFSNNGTTERLQLLRFGSNLTNEIPTRTNLGNFNGRTHGARDLTVVTHRDSVFAFLTNPNRKDVVRVTLSGTTLGNSASDVISAPPFTVAQNGLRGIGLVRDCSRWYGLVISEFSRFYRLDFGNSPATTPTVEDLTNDLNVNVIDGSRLRFVTDQDDFFAFVSSAENNLYRLRFESTMAATPAVANLGNFGLGNDLNQTYKYYRDGSRWYGLAVDRQSRRQYQITFLQQGSTIPSVDTVAAPTVVFEQPGTYAVTLRATNQRRAVSTATQTVVVEGGTPAGCNAAAFSLGSAFVCAQEPLMLTNDTDPPAASYRWDFSTGELFNTPEIDFVGSPLPVSSGFQYADVEPAFDSTTGQWYAFVSDFADDKLLRLAFGTDPGNDPVVSELNVAAETIDQPRKIRLLREDGNWYGLLCSQANSTLIRLNFGPSLTNDAPTLTAFPVPFPPTDFDLVDHLTDGLTGVLTSIPDNAVGVVNFGESVTNTPQVYRLPTPASVATTQVRAVSLARGCNDYVAFVSVTTNGQARVLRYAFGNSLLNRPDVAPIAAFDLFYAGTSSTIVSTGLARERNEQVLFVLSDNGRVARARFATSIDGAPIVQNLGDFGQSEVPRGFTLVQDGSRWQALTVNVGTGQLRRYLFPENAAAVPAISTEATPTDVSYLEPGEYVISLTAVDSAGAVSTAVRNVSVREDVIASFTPDGNLCPGEPISFNSTSQATTGGIAGLTWDFGDNTTSNETTPTHVYSEPGTYTVTLTASSSLPNGCDGVATQTLRIYPEPVPDISVGSNPCSNDSIAFNGSVTIAPDDSITTWNWSFTTLAGTLLGTSDTPLTNQFFTNDGPVVATLTVTGLGNCAATVIDTIEVAPGPAVSFSVTNTCIDQTASFTSNIVPNGTVTALQWSFGDGSVLFDEPNPQHQYPAPGEYLVSLTVSNDQGCTVVRQQTVRISGVPSVALEIQNQGGGRCAGNPIGFQSLQVISDGPYTLTYDFGDGSDTTVTSPGVVLYSYGAAGTYPVSLTITTEAGCTFTDVDSVTIAPAPTATFTVSDTAVCLGEAVAFSIVGPTEPNTSRLWDMGNGAFFADTAFTYVYPAPGTYSVTLETEAGDNGCTATASQTVRVVATPAVAFAVTEGCVGVPFRFADQTVSGQADSVVSYAWNFGGFGTATTPNPTFTFTEPGTYAVRLDVTTALGCTGTVNQEVTVGEAPTAAFTFELTTAQDPPYVVRFTNNSVNAETFFWDFGDGTISTDTVPEHGYASTGTYEVTLVAGSGSLCADTARQTITVIARPEPGVAVAQLELIRDGFNLVVATDLRNEGNVALTNLRLTADLGGLLTLQEVWTGTLAPGATERYNFAAQIVSPNDVPVEYVCVTASLADTLADVAPENNRLCTVVSPCLAVFGPFPNPATQSTAVRFTVAEPGQVTLTVVDMLGREAYRGEVTRLDRGVYEQVISLADFRPGVYHLTVETRDCVERRRFVVQQP